jgi:hypothetical protein
VKVTTAGYFVDPYGYNGQGKLWLSPSNDGRDNYGDVLIDWPNDPECESPSDDSEETDCNDGVDNDLDGLVDYPDDLDCDDISDIAELPEPGQLLMFIAGAALLLQFNRVRQKSS